MENDDFLLGNALKGIRENKGYTQKEIADHTMSRSNYSKFEKNQVNPNVAKYFAILDYLDIHHDEFRFILNDYSLNKKDTVLFHFKEMEHKPDIHYIKALISACEELFTEREDHITRDIYNVALGYLALLEEYDLQKAKKHAGKVWDRLKELDKFYLSEHHLLNGILYYFELETAIALTDRSLKDLERYYSFKEADELMISLLLNISSILIAYKEYEQALTYIDLLIEKSKQSYDVLSTGSGFSRKGFCLKKLNNKEEAKHQVDLAIELFEIVDRHDLIDQVKESPEAVYNPYIYVDLQNQ